MNARRDHAAELRRTLADVPRVVAALGLDRGAQRQASGLLVCCPWHDERTPSCSVTRGRDGTIRVRCFGCSATGDVLALVAQVNGLDLRRDFVAVLRRAAELANAYDVLADLDAGPVERRTFPVEPRSVERRTFPEEPVADDEPQQLDADSYDAVATFLLGACPLDGDVARYVEGRGLLQVAQAAGLGALPPYAAQAPLVARMVERFGVDTLVAAGLLNVGDDGPDLRAFRSPAARLLIPWRGPGVAALVDVLQRRRIDSGQPKYVAPAGRRQRHPFGVDTLEIAGPDTSVAYVEGALDALAVAAFAAQEGLDVVALGLPGVSSWRSSWASYAAGRVARIALDADAAGEGKVAELQRDLHAAGAARVTRLRPPQGFKDWCDALVARVKGQV